MEQDLSTVLTESSLPDTDSAMPDSHYDSQDPSSAGGRANGSSSPGKDLPASSSSGGGADSHAQPPSTPPDHYRREKSPRSPKSYSSSRMRTPYERPPASSSTGDSYRGSSGAPGTSDYRDGGSSYRPGGSEGYSKYSSGKRDPSRPSRRECRVYVGNLAYEVGWQELKDFMRKVGEVVYADILTQPSGRSKGCGVVEFATPEEAQRSIRELSDTSLMGRPVFIREDREQEAKFGSGPGRTRGPPGSSYHPGGHGDASGRQIFVGNLPYIVAWQDLKDLFRQAGNVVRADVQEGPDRRSKGVGTVLFETAAEAHAAISMFDGYELHGRRLEVRE
ncbi:hypothetical protein HK102_009318, partial [Quaeritorhiza haematococci]